MALHRKDARAAAHGYASLFAGEHTPGAIAAGVRLSTFVEYQIAFVEAHAKRRK